MAKVMISLPDDFLARIDAQASQYGSTRSATIRELAEAGLGERQQRLTARMAALEGHAVPREVDVVEAIKPGRGR
jgi:metal-responsive CopG/Arc/MetJ family transcriptional regulator